MDAILIVVVLTTGLGLGFFLRASSATRSEVSMLARKLAESDSLLATRLEGLDTRLAGAQAANQGLAVDIFETLGDLRRSTAAVAEQAKEFSTLQDLLKAPKARGGLGEALLEELLRQVLPPNAYSIQHRFSSGAIVDAVVKAGGRLVCIDSKFPLANFQRDDTNAFADDVARHIKDISTRYIVPDEGTLDFAVMYVPAEGVYSEVLRLSDRRRPLFETAIASRVVPMSPLTLYGYLQTILYGMRCLQIEEHAEHILDYCSRLQQDMSRFAEEYDTLGRHLGHARLRYEDGSRRLDRLRDRLERVAEMSGPEDGDGSTSLEAVNS